MFNLTFQLFISILYFKRINLSNFYYVSLYLLIIYFFFSEFNSILNIFLSSIFSTGKLSFFSQNLKLEYHNPKIFQTTNEEKLIFDFIQEFMMVNIGDHIRP